MVSASDTAPPPAPRPVPAPPGFSVGGAPAKRGARVRPPTPVASQTVPLGMGGGGTRVRFPALGLGKASTGAVPGGRETPLPKLRARPGTGSGVTISVPRGEAVAVFMGMSAQTHQFVILDGAGTAVDRKTHRFAPALGDDPSHEITLEDFTLD